jgi:hypothetical protein
MKGVKHYKKDGTLFTGNTHKMPNGSLQCGCSLGQSLPLKCCLARLRARYGNSNSKRGLH